VRGDMRKKSRTMTVDVSKSLAIQLFAYAREAERSVDYANRGPDQWDLLREYYGPKKQEALRGTVEQLERLIPTNPPLLERHQFEKAAFISLLRLPIVRLLNLKRLNWRFSHSEIIFIHQCFRGLMDTLRLRPAPPAQILVNMRMDFFACECIIARRLYGISELEKASRVEHFCQPDHIEHVTMDDLLERELTGVEKRGVGATGLNQVSIKAAQANGDVSRKTGT
jgi:hypothetical protein